MAEKKKKKKSKKKYPDARSLARAYDKLFGVKAQPMKSGGIVTRGDKLSRASNRCKVF
jgi:hypothetical protein